MRPAAETPRRRANGLTTSQQLFYLRFRVHKAQTIVYSLGMRSPSGPCPGEPGAWMQGIRDLWCCIHGAGTTEER
jgi:hypothetical protein